MLPAHATAAERLMLDVELSPWRSDLYVHTAGPVPRAETVTIAGTFLTRVYEGPYRDAPKWCEDMTAYVASKGRDLKKLYFGYTTCPSCAKAYGKNYVVLFAEVSPLPAQRIWRRRRAGAGRRSTLRTVRRRVRGLQFPRAVPGHGRFARARKTCGSRGAVGVTARSHRRR